MLVLEYEEFIASAAGATRLFSFLEVPEPVGLWPLPPVNVGEYDWGRCKQAWHQSRRRMIYDDSNNIIGARDVAAVPNYSFPSEPCGVSPDVLALVVRRYAGEGEALRRLDLLRPRRWTVPE